MSRDDAREWAWTYARSRGNARLVVLAVVDKAAGPDVTARLGVAEARSRLGGVGKGTAIKAIADAVASGDLEVVEEAAGSRATLYRVPGAVGYVRGSGPDSRPQPASPDRSGFQTTNGQRSGFQTTTAPATGPGAGPVAPPTTDGLWSEFQTASGPDSGPHHSTTNEMSEGVREGAPALDLTGGNIPAAARPLVDKITAAGIYPAWSLTVEEWFRLEAMVKRSGVDMLAAVAVRAAAKTEIRHARYLLRAWQSLPPAPPAGTTAPTMPTGPGPASNVIPFGAAAQARRGPAAQSADYLAAALAAMEAQQ